MIKKYFLLVFVFFFLHNIYSQTTAIPDANFEQALINNSIDSDGVVNGSVLTSDISGVSYLSVNNKNIHDLTGIEGFTALIQLNCQVNELTSLDLSQNVNLLYLMCYSNQLTSLDVSQNTVLSYLQGQNNKLTNLDVSQNTALTRLKCYDNQLSSLDLSKNTSLNHLRSYGNSLLYCIQVDNVNDANAGLGLYQDWVKDASCTYSEDCGYALGIDEVLAQAITYYPNPVNNLLRIDSEIPISKVEIYSVLGQKVKEINSDFKSIPIDNLSNGVYIVRIHSENGIATKKLIKK